METIKKYISLLFEQGKASLIFIVCLLALIVQIIFISFFGGVTAGAIRLWSIICLGLAVWLIFFKKK